jgi:heme exporter protein B
MTNISRVLISQLAREWMIHYRNPRQILYSCVFFVMTLVFFPLTISADTTILRTLAPGLIWINLLFAFFLSSERLFQYDYDDGIIEQWLVSGYPVYLLTLIKVGVHGVLNILPMLLLCPFIAMFLHLSIYETGILMFSIICGAPAILFLCALAAAFSTGLKQKGVLMALILFPLTIPVMIFASYTLVSVMQGASPYGYLALLLALSVVAVGFLPFAIAAVIQLSLSD